MDNKLIKAIEAYKSNKSKKRDYLWLEHFYELLRYKHTFGHTNVPLNPNDHKKLGNWIRWQRQLHSKGQLDTFKKKLLQQIGFNFKVIPHRLFAWDLMFNRLVLFKQEFGLSSLNKKKDPQLQTWVIHQRVLLKAGKLNRTHYDKLLSIGAELNERRAYKWKKKFEQLLKFKEQYGHVLVNKYSTNDKQLMNFVRRIRYTKNKLSEEQINSLDSIGFIWEKDSNRIKEQMTLNWHKRYEQLKAFKEKHGHCQIPVKSDEYFSLLYWVNKQKSNKDLAEEKRILLEEIGAFEGLRLHIWNKKFERLVEFKKQFGHTLVRRTYTNDKQLLNFVKHLRFVKDKLPQYQIDQLNEIDFIWSPSPSQGREKRPKIYKKPLSPIWLADYQQVKDYKEKHGHLPLLMWPRKDRPLYNWIQAQWQNKNLYKEKRKLLKELGIFENRQLTKWNEKFEQLVEFKKQFGHTLVSYTYTIDQQLINFVKYLRRRKDELSQDQINQLNNISFTWETTSKTVVKRIQKKMKKS